MKPSPHFLGVLNQLQLRVRHAVASTGVGERRSKAKGAGMEFADYRSYIQGDDTRHLDARLYARLGDYYIRQYEVLKQLPVTLVVDGSRSMTSGNPSKLAVAQWLANAMGYLALVGGDTVQAAFWSGRRLAWSPRFHGVRRADRLFAWVEAVAPEDALPFEAAIGEVTSQLPRRGLVLLLSDLWLEQPPAALQALASGAAEVWAFQILAPEERDPPVQASGEVQVIDLESGETVLLAMDSAMIARYREALATWQDDLAEAVRSINGTLVEVRSDEDLEKVLLGLRTRGLLT